MRRRYIWHAGDWVDVTGWRPGPRKTPYIIRDGMDALQHPCTGEVIDSKSTFRRITRERGCEEVGDQAPVTTAPPPLPSVREDLIAAIDMVNQGYRPAPLREFSAASAEDGLPAEVRTYN